MERVTFYSDGLKLTADLFLPESIPEQGAPGFVFCGGWGGGKRRRAGEFCAGLAARGFVGLAFEYRGWGDTGNKSEGDNDRLFPHEHTWDTRSAAHYLAQRPDVDAERIAVMGMFNGAAVALQAASEDTGIAGVVGLFPFGDGGRWMKEIRRFHEWGDFQARLVADRRQRAVSGQSEVVHPDEILIRDDVARARIAKNHAANPDQADWRLSLDSADAIATFRPEDHVHRIAPRPTLLIAAELDTLLPLEEVELLYEKVREPRELLVLKGVTHDGTFEPAQEEVLFGEIAGFLQGAWAATR